MAYGLGRNIALSKWLSNKLSNFMELKLLQRKTMLQYVVRVHCRRPVQIREHAWKME